LDHYVESLGKTLTPSVHLKEDSKSHPLTGELFLTVEGAGMSMRN
jgi:hypothetical protein